MLSRPFILLLLASVIGLVFSILQFVSYSLTYRAESEVGALIGATSTYSSSAIETDARLIFRNWEKVQGLSFFNPDSLYSYGRAATMMSSLQDSFDDKISYICKAYESYFRATKKSPFNAKFQIARADIETQVPHVFKFCGIESDREAKLTAVQRLDYAVGLMPFGGVETYLAAIVYAANGKKNKALNLLRQNRELNPHFTLAQRDYVYQFVSTRSDLEAAISRRYPDVINWINHFYINRKGDFESWFPVFEAALDEAVEDLVLREQQRADEVNSEAFIKAVAHTPVVLRSNLLRAKLDGYLAGIYRKEGKREWSDFLKRRAELIRIPVLKSYISDDLKPGSTMLFGWLRDHEERVAALDHLGRALGIYVPEKNRVKNLVLQSVDARAGLNEDSIKLLVSSDNLIFHELKSGFTTSKLLVEGKEVLVVEFDNSNFRFLKIRYSGTERRPKFINNLESLVQVYGLKEGAA